MPGRACIILFIVLAVAAGIPAGHAQTTAKKSRVAVIPFYERGEGAAGTRVSSVLSAELASRNFIEIVSPEVVRREVLEVRPDYILTGRRRAERTKGTPADKEPGRQEDTAERKDARGKGAVYWKIEPKVIEEVARRTDADYTVSGELSWFNERWTMSVFAADVRNKTTRAFTVSGNGEEEIPSGIEDAAARIAVFIRDATIVDEVEGEVRKYRGGMYSLPVVISKLENLSLTYQDSLPVQALLLDLYLEDRTVYRKKIAAAARKVIALYDPANDNDTRYLLSRSLDPFDVLAGIYEEGREWKKAIDTRRKALEVFAFNAQKHRKAIERDLGETQAPRKRKQ